MCGRFALSATPQEVQALFAYVDTPNFPPRYNIAPTQPVATVRQAHGARRFVLVRWGLVPGWVKDPASFSLLINARAETAAEKPSFRAAMRHRRCLIPASGFYEWQRPDAGPKQPYWIRPRDGGIVAFAGLWEEWCDPDGGEIDTGAILTVAANSAIAPIHNRMPAVIAPEDFDIWLDVQNTPLKEARALLRPAPESLFEALPVSTRVNSAREDAPELLEPVAVESAPDRTGGSAEAVLPAPRKKKTRAAKGARSDDDQFDLF
ncbi:SOS response-associated peptidase [Stappia stellulata]|uniref:SOS response-associated peptidase n=1 Tax=Stappia stellulata TaxID=71235 RepID=UPI0004057E50|nr:SOS response-associated peptidase [Stappia stellulata]